MLRLQLLRILINSIISPAYVNILKPNNASKNIIPYNLTESDFLNTWLIENRDIISKVSGVKGV